MDISKLKKVLPDFFKKYKYVVLILCIGFVLMLIPAGRTQKQEADMQQTTKEAHISGQELEMILTRIKGAGRVKVLLSLDKSQITHYQTDDEQSNNDSDSHVQSKTIIVTDASRNEAGLISGVAAPRYRGAIIVCDGADNPTVRLALINAVSNVTGLRSDQIAVLKME